jgi:hypothetical protein
MKNISVCLLMFISINCFATNAEIGTEKGSYPPDTTKLANILTINLQSYISKPVDSLLKVLPQDFTNRTFMPIGIGYAKGISQSYFTSEFNNCIIEIYIDTFKFVPMPNYDYKRNWSMDLVKKETISFIKVLKNSFICVYGCNDDKYYYP